MVIIFCGMAVTSPLAQDSLYFFQIPGQKYLVFSATTQWGGGGGFGQHVRIGEVTPYALLNERQYYFNPYFNAPMAYDQGKIYWLGTGNVENLFTDFTLPSGTSYTGAIPLKPAGTLTITKSSQSYRVYNDDYSFYFKKDFGINNHYYSYSWGGPLPGSFSEDCSVKEMKYPKPDGSYFVFLTPFTPRTTIAFDDTITTPQTFAQLTSPHQYSQGYPTAIDFWEKAEANIVYSKEGSGSVYRSVMIPRRYKEDFQDTLRFDESLLREGYSLSVNFVLTDKGVLPNTFRYPTTGYYTIKYFRNAADFYTSTPGFRNYYGKYLITPDNSDTVLVGEVQQEFAGDTLIGTKVFKRERLFGKEYYFTRGTDNLTAVFNYLNQQGEPVAFAWDTLAFCAGEPRPIHYLDTGEKLRYMGDHPDSMAGIQSTVYHLKGGINGDEELVYKARTGPVLIVRYEPDEIGVLNKFMYLLTRVNNNGVTTRINSRSKGGNETELPASIMISENYPNPFNPSTRVVVRTAESTQLTFSIYSSSGEKIRSFTRDYAGAGDHPEEIDLAGYPSGVWFLTVTDANGVRIKMLKLALLK